MPASKGEAVSLGTEWRPINTAPTEFVAEYRNENPHDNRLPYRVMRMGRVVMVRGTHDGDTEEFKAVWTVLDDQPGYWFEDEPVDWPITEWRELTPEEMVDVTGKA